MILAQTANTPTDETFEEFPDDRDSHHHRGPSPVPESSFYGLFFLTTVFIMLIVFRGKQKYGLLQR